MPRRWTDIRWDLSLANIGVAIFAALGVWSTRYRWIAIEQGGGNWRIPHYHSSEIFFWACVAALVMAFGRLIGLVGGRTYAACVGAFGTVALVAWLWLIAFVAGDGAAYLSDTYVASWAEFVATPGLTMAACASIGVLLFAALTQGIWPRRLLKSRPLDGRTRAVAFCAFLMLAAVFMPWASTLDALESGVEYSSALGTTAPALLLLAAVAGRAVGTLSDSAFRASAAALGAIAFAIAYSFYADVVGSVDPAYHTWLVQWVEIPRVQAAAGLYVSLSASASVIVAACWPATRATARPIRARLARTQAVTE